MLSGRSAKLPAGRAFDARRPAVVGWAALSTGQMHPGMHPIDDDLVRRLIAAQFPQWAGLAVQRPVQSVLQQARQSVTSNSTAQ